MITHEPIDHVLIATLLASLAFEICVDVGSTGAVLIGVLACPIVLLLAQRQPKRI